MLFFGKSVTEGHEVLDQDSVSDMTFFFQVRGL